MRERYLTLQLTALENIRAILEGIVQPQTKL
jgi:hypothetical protein